VFGRWTWAGGLAVAALVAGYLVWTLNSLERDLIRRAGEAASLKREVGQRQELLKILGAPDTQVVALDGLKASPGARGWVWWRQNGGGFFVANGLPAAPAGKTYQLWAIAGGTAVSAGVFMVDPKGSATLRVKPLAGVGKVEMFAVTLEPVGGLPKPSGQMYLVGKTS
jgi:hypothetical protein